MGERGCIFLRLKYILQIALQSVIILHSGLIVCAWYLPASFPSLLIPLSNGY